ncbi:MAG: hypothetical protein WBN90_01705 [Gammaproteobacteria bacterium]
MQDLICPFSATLVKDDFGCRRAGRIIRRGGSEIACDSADAWRRCSGLFQKLKDTALPAFGVEDDLLQVPHGVLVKIQFGGLLGVQRISGATATGANGISDIDALLESSIRAHGSVDSIPFSSLCEDMTAYKLARRGKRR